MIELIQQAQDLPQQVADPVDTFVDFYNNNLRQGFFVGFLTVATFLFSALTQVVFRMKENVFDSPTYRDEYETARKTPRFKDSLYGPLRRFKKLVLLSICSAFLTSLVQLLVLWLDENWAAYVALGFVVLTALLLALCIWSMWTNLRDWLNRAETEAEAEQEQKRRRSSGV